MSSKKKEGDSPQVRQRKNVSGSQDKQGSPQNVKKSKETKKSNGKGGSTNTNVLINAPDSAGAGSFFQKLLKRVIVGVILLSGFAGIVVSDHLYVSLLVILVQGVVYKEIISLRLKRDEGKGRKLPFFRTLNWYFFAISLVYVYGQPFLQYLNAFIPAPALALMTKYHLFASFALYCAGFVVFILTLESGKYKHQFMQSAWTLMTLVMIVAQSSVVIKNIFDGLIWFLLPSSLVIFNDIMAYFCGVLFGKKILNRPFLALSPNKTWEGFLGAGIFTVIFGFFFAQFLSQFQWFTCPKHDFSIGQLDCVPDPIFSPTVYPLPSFVIDALKTYFAVNITSVTLIPMQLHAAWFGVFASLVAPFGGFFASGLKRAFDIKDFDSLFPGHGGMTDRMDCQLLMGLCVFVHLHTFVKVGGGVTVAGLLQNASLLSGPQQVELYQKLGQLVGA